MDKFVTITKRKSTDDQTADKNNNETTLAKHGKYEKTKRKRCYVKTWEETWPWVRHDDINDTMYCTICREFPAVGNVKNNSFYEGCKLFRVESLKAHQTSDVHVICSSFYRQKNGTPVTKDGNQTHVSDNVNVRATPIMTALLKLDENQMKRLDALFNIAYKIAKHGKPHSDFEIDCKLIQKLGVDLGNNYLNANRCKDFIKSIADAMTEAVADDLKGANFVSVLSDGSTDCSNLEQENVLVRYVSPKTRNPVTIFCGIVNLEHGHADGVLDGIFRALSLVGLTKENLKANEPGPTLICANFDGANVMQGKKNGVVGKLVKEYNHVLGMWCIAHKLQLAVMDSVKDVQSLQKLESTLKGIYKYYHGSPKRRREIKAIADILDADLAHIPDVKDVSFKMKYILLVSNVY